MNGPDNNLCRSFEMPAVSRESPSDEVFDRPVAPDPAQKPAAADTPKPREIGGPTGPEPTRYGDWERKGRCIDF